MNETESVITSFAEDVSTAVSRVSELWLGFGGKEIK